jgi:hypothetical protein
VDFRSGWCSRAQSFTTSFRVSPGGARAGGGEGRREEGGGGGGGPRGPVGVGLYGVTSALLVI